MRTREAKEARKARKKDLGSSESKGGSLHSHNNWLVHTVDVGTPVNTNKPTILGQSPTEVGDFLAP